MAIVSVSGMAIVSTIVGSGGISLRFSISGSFVELRDTIGGSRGGDVLVASAGGIVGSKSSVSIRITISVRVAVGTSVQVCGISFSFGISRPLAKMVGISVSSISVRIAVVSTIVSSVSTIVS